MTTYLSYISGSARRDPQYPALVEFHIEHEPTEGDEEQIHEYAMTPEEARALAAELNAAADAAEVKS